MNIGETIRKKRKEYHYTQQDLAGKLLISRTTISSWETGRTYPDLSMLLALSEVFETSVDYLLKGDGKMVSAMDRNARKGRSLKYYLGAFLLVLALIGAYFSLVYIKTNNLYEHVKDWEKIGGAYSISDGDMIYMVGYVETLDIRNISTQLGILANRANDDNSQVTMTYNGHDDDIQVTFHSGPIEGMSINFTKDFILQEEVAEPDKVKYSYEIRKEVNTVLERERAYLQETFSKVKNKWTEINGIEL